MFAFNVLACVSTSLVAVALLKSFPWNTQAGKLLSEHSSSTGVLESSDAELDFHKNEIGVRKFRYKNRRRITILVMVLCTYLFGEV